MSFSNSMLKQILSVRKEFEDSGDLGYNLISKILGHEIFEPTQITASNGSLLTLESEIPPQTGMYFVKVKKTMTDGSVQLINESHCELDPTEDEPNPELNFDAVGTDGNSFGDILNDISETCNFNYAIASMTRVFATQPTINTQTLIECIDTCCSPTDASGTQLKQLITMNAPTGNISNFQFLNILQSILKSGSEAVSGGSLTMDSTKAYFVKNAICTVLRAIVDTLATALQAVFLIIGGLLGVIGFILSSVAKFVVGWFANNVRQNVVVSDPSSTVPYVKGAITCTQSKNRLSGLQSFRLEDVEDDSHALRVDFGGMDCYLWPKGYNQITNKPSGLSINSFLKIELHPVRTANWIWANFREQNHLKTDSWEIYPACQYDSYDVAVPTYFGFQRTGVHDALPAIPSFCYLNEEELAELPWMDDKTLQLYLAFNMSVIGWLSLVAGESDDYDNNPALHGTRCAKAVWPIALQDYWAIWRDTNGVPVDEHSVLHWLFFQFCNMVKVLSPNSPIYERTGSDALNYDDCIEDYKTKINDYPDLFTKVSIALCSRLNKYSSDVNIYNNLGGTTLRDGCDPWLDGRSNTNVYYMRHPVGRVLTFHGLEDNVVRIRAYDSYYEHNDYEVTDCIPSTRMFDLPNVTWQQIVGALVVTTAIAVAAVTVAAIGKVKFKKFAMQKQMKLLSNIQSAKAKYINADTGEIIGDSSDFNLLYKSIRKYNKAGKWLGWGTYDLANGWTNDPAVTTADIVSAATPTQLVDKVGSDVLDGITVDLTNKTISIKGDADVSISDVLHAIIG